MFQRRIVNYFFLLCFTCLQTCNIAEKNNIYELKNKYEDLIKTEIKLPGSLELLYSDSLSKISDPMSYKGKVKIVSRIMGTCPQCVTELLDWEEEFIKFIDTSEVKFLFYIFTDDYHFFKEVIFPDIQINYPLIIDRNDTMLTINNLPKDDSRFHTFLLNESNFVVLFGSPINNDNLKRLYFQEIKRLTFD